MKLLIKVTLAFVFLPCILAGCAVAQKVKLSTDEAVRKELAKNSDLKPKLDRLGIERIQGTAAIIVIGTHANDRGCRLEGAFIGSAYFEDSTELSQKALAALGWKKANQKRFQNFGLKKACWHLRRCFIQKMRVLRAMIFNRRESFQTITERSSSRCGRVL